MVRVTVLGFWREKLCPYLVVAKTGGARTALPPPHPSIQDELSLLLCELCLQDKSSYICNIG